MIDQSDNNFFGSILIYFFGFSLLSLDLSFINFEGNVPMDGVFANVNAMSLVGNSRLYEEIRATIAQIHRKVK